MSAIRFFRTFLAVARHGSFSEAAERVALTQAAVSFQMRALETELGRELFDRSGRLAVLNAAGQQLLPEAEQLLDLYDRIRFMRQPGASELTGSVSVGAIVSCMGPLSKVVSQLKRDHTGLDVRVLSGKSGELEDKVASGELDAALVVESARLPVSLRWSPLYEERLVVVAPRSARGRTAKALLEGSPFLRFDRTQRTGAQIARVLRRLNVQVRDFLELNAIETVVELVRQEVGVTLLPELRGTQWRQTADLRVLDLPADAGPIARRVGMIDRREHSRQHITAAIFKQYAQACGAARGAAADAERA